MQGFYVQLKADKISLVYHTNQTKKMNRAKQKKNRWAIKSGNGHKNPWDPSEKVRETMVQRTYGKGKFWVWSRTEMEWCIVKVVIIMVMMMNRWKKDEMTVTDTHHRQVDEVLWEVHSRNEERHGGKSGCWLSKRNKKVDEQGRQHQRNKFCEVVEER